MMDFVAATLRISAPVIVWTLHFAVIYGVAALACARGVPAAAPIGVAVATVAAVAALIPLIVAGFRRREVFESRMGATLGALAFVAVTWEAIPALLVPPCG